MKSKILFTFALLACALRAQAINIYDEDTPCTQCRCYKVKCARLQEPDIDCEDTYLDSCDNQDDITEENDCNLKCDCCLEKQCFNWLTYYCLMYRSFEFSSVMYFLFFSINFFVIWRLKNFLFEVKKNWNIKKYQNEKKVKNDKKYFFKYKHFIWLSRHPDIYKKNVSEKKVKMVISLFTDLEKLKIVAIKNVIFYSVITLYYFLTSIFQFIVMFYFYQKPFLYGIIAWFQHFSMIVLWLMFLIAFYRFKSY